MTDTDNMYWKTLLMDASNNHDPLACNINNLKGLLPLFTLINQTLPEVIARLETDRKDIVRKTEKTFSDIMSMLDEFHEEDESTYETAVRICDHYRKSLEKK